MGYDKQGYTRYDNQRIKKVIGPHIALLTGVEFNAELNFTAASVQYMETTIQSSNIQFSRDDVNTIEEVGNIIKVKVQANGVHAITFTNDIIIARNDYAGFSGVYHFVFQYELDGKILVTVIQES